MADWIDLLMGSLFSQNTGSRGTSSYNRPYDSGNDLLRLYKATSKETGYNTPQGAAKKAAKAQAAVNNQANALGNPTVGPTSYKSTATPSTTAPTGNREQDFVNQMLPYAIEMEQQTGIPAAYTIAMAANETGFDASNPVLFGIKGPSPSGQSGSFGTWEEYGGNRQNITDTFATYKDKGEAFQHLAKNMTSERYKNAPKNDPKAFAQYLQQQGWATDSQYANKISNLAGRVTAIIPKKPTGTTTGTSNWKTFAQDQFGDPTLSFEDAKALCGPAVAISFAKAKGRNPTLEEAKQLAVKYGWTQEKGMPGAENQQKLMREYGTETQMTGPDWNLAQKYTSEYRPVVLSSPNHYFLATAYDPQKGYYVGASGRAYKSKGGKDWMTQQEMERIGGPVTSMLYE